MDKSNRQRYPLPSRNPQSFADRPKSYRRTTYYEDLVRAQKQANKANDKKAHFKKWWWAYFSGLIVLILIIILPIVLVAIPKIAQEQLNEAIVEIRSQVIRNPTPQSVDIVLVTASLSNSSLSPTLEGFEVDLFLQDTLPNYKPFARLAIPSIRSTGETIVPIVQTLRISDMDQFINYNKLIVSSTEYSFGMRGNVTLRQAGLPTQQLVFNKIITSNGLNKLSGFQVVDPTLSLQPAADGTNMLGTAGIPNPTNMTVELGTILSDLFVDGTMIGNSTLQNVVLQPGLNRLPFRGAVRIDALLPLLARHTNLKVPMEARARSVTRNGANLVYYTEALRANPIRFEVDVADALPNIPNLLDFLRGVRRD